MLSILLNLLQASRGLKWFPQIIHGSTIWFTYHEKWSGWHIASIQHQDPNIFVLASLAHKAV